MGQKKIILDTNVYVSALGYDGNEREVLRRCLKGGFSLYLTNEIIAEVERVLEYPKFDFTPAQKDAIKLILTEIGNIVQPIRFFNLVKADPSDDKFLTAAISAEADFLITGDNHLLRLKQIGKTRILNSADFLKAVS